MLRSCSSDTDLVDERSRGAVTSFARFRRRYQKFTVDNMI